MRSLLIFQCEKLELAATLDAADGDTGLLMVTGGSQTRVGSHRMYERLAAALAERGVSCFRFDRRGVGDSDGEDPGFLGSGPDMAAAAAAFRQHRPGLARLLGFGLCDGATALALHGGDAGLDGLILVNPWLVEAESGAPPPAAIRRRYREQLTSLSGWKRLLTGAISYRKLVQGLARIAAPAEAGLAQAMAAALDRSGLQVSLVLARGDATAIAAQAEWDAPRFATVRARAGAPIHIDSYSHTFAHCGDPEALLEACLRVLDR